MDRATSTRTEKRARFADVGGRPLKGGLVQVTVTLDPDDLETLRREAKRRSHAREGTRADWSASELIRLAIAEWIGAHVKGGRKP